VATFSRSSWLVARMDSVWHLGGTSRGRWLLGITFAVGCLCGYVASESKADYRSSRLAQELARSKEQGDVWRYLAAKFRAENMELTAELEHGK